MVSIFFICSITLYLFSSFSSIETWILLFEKVVIIELELVESFLILAVLKKEVPLLENLLQQMKGLYIGPLGRHLFTLNLSDLKGLVFCFDSFTSVLVLLILRMFFCP